MEHRHVCGSQYLTINSTTAPTDTDGDGMPDAYEEANSLDAYDATDGAAKAANGYTNLENYLNGLVEDITEAQNAGGTPAGNIEQSTE